MWQRFSEASRNAILRGQALAIDLGSSDVSSAHLFLGVLQESGEEGTVANLLKLSGVTFEEARLYGQSGLEASSGNETQEPKLTANAKRVLEYAADEARQLKSEGIDLEHLFIACVRAQKRSHVGDVLRPLGLDVPKLRDHLRGFTRNEHPYQKGNPLNSLTEGSQKAIEAAHAAMRDSYCGRISTAHLLLGLLANENSKAVELLQDAGVDPESLRALTRAQVTNDGEVAAPQKKFSPAAKRALERGREEAKKCGHTFIGPEHLLSALLPQPVSVQEKLAFGNNADDPLTPVWATLPVSEIRREYEKLWGKPRVPLKRKLTVSFIKRWETYVGIVSFLVGICWLGVLLTPWGRSAFGGGLIFAGLFVMISSGIGACGALVFNRSKFSKNFWLSVFSGFLLGLLSGIFLSSL